MFRLTKAESQDLKLQSTRSSWGSRSATRRDDFKRLDSVEIVAPDPTPQRTDPQSTDASPTEALYYFFGLIGSLVVRLRDAVSAGVLIRTVPDHNILKEL
jgi:hypothetical protein